MAAKQKLNNFKMLEKLGEGTYGCVFKAIDKTDQTVVALKRMALNDNGEFGIPASAVREIALLRELFN